MSKKTISILISVLVISIGVMWWQVENMKTGNLPESGQKAALQANQNNQGPTATPIPTVADVQTETLTLKNKQVTIPSEGLSDNQARFYNIQISSGKTINFFVVMDRNGIYRAAANACQVCFSSKQGFRQEGFNMVCNTCRNSYPLEKIATEKGGCNPAPINPNLTVKNGQITIAEAELEQVAEFF